MSAPLPEITPLGDSALIVRVRDEFENAPAETSSAVMQTVDRLRHAQIPGVLELAPAYTTVAVFIDPIGAVRAGAKPNAILDWFKDRIRQVLAPGGRLRRPKEETRVIEIPVCYDAQFGPDLGEVAQQAHLSPAEVIDLHSAARYRVACVGFTPGFPFLTGLDRRLATPRRATPRKEIPEGSVGIGGGQTGIYPLRSPGGWNIIGRTPLRLFDAERNPPALLHAGDQVQFRKIDRDQFDAFG